MLGSAQGWSRPFPAGQCRLPGRHRDAPLTSPCPLAVQAALSRFATRRAEARLRLPSLGHHGIFPYPLIHLDHCIACPSASQPTYHALILTPLRGLPHRYAALLLARGRVRAHLYGSIRALTNAPPAPRSCGHVPTLPFSCPVLAGSLKPSPLSATWQWQCTLPSSFITTSSWLLSLIPHASE